MIRKLFTIAALCFAGAAASAQNVSLSEADRSAFRDIQAHLQKTGESWPNEDLSKANVKDRFVRSMVLSNITPQSLEKLLLGNYYVLKDPASGFFDVVYFAKDRAFICSIYSDKATESVGYWSRGLKTAAGFAGYATSTTPDMNGWLGNPVIYNPKTGQIFNFKEVNRKYLLSVGHIQKEYAPVFEQNCPNLPKSNAFNAQQTAKDYDTFRAQGEKGVLRSAVPVIFNIDPRSPLTVEKYLALMSGK